MTNEAKTLDGRITQAELARRLGVSRPSVSKAVKSGRITPDENGRFDPLQAEKEWLRNTRPSAKKSKADAHGYAAARARKESALARMAELELETKLGNLLPRDEVDWVLEDLGAMLRGLLESLPDRLAPLVAPRSSVGEVHALIAEAAHDVLCELHAAIGRRMEAEFSA